MAIEIRETFQVHAPIDAVWRFVMDPQAVVTCMPGAALEQVVDEGTFLGSVKIKVGAITTSYKGRVQFAHVDEQEHTVQLIAEGRETSGGMAKGTMSSRLRPLPDGQTEVVAEASVDLTGRIMQVGRGMIQGVSQQLFQQFAAALKQRLETAEHAMPDGLAAAPSPVKPIRILPLMLQALWAAIVGAFRKLLPRR